jgi:hypothetical protein
VSLAADRLYRLLSVWMPEGFRAFRSVAVLMPGGAAPVAEIVVAQGELGSFEHGIPVAEVHTVVDLPDGAVDYLGAGVPCHWRVIPDAGPAVRVGMSGAEVRMFAAGMVGLPLVAGREIVVPIDPLMIVPGR